MHEAKAEYLFAVSLSVTLHALVLAAAGLYAFKPSQPETPTPEEKVVFLEMLAAAPPEPPADPAPAPTRPLPAAAPARPAPSPAIGVPTDATPAPAAQDPPRTQMEAPPAPSAEEWARASTYKLKNSKRYRHTWGQQIRSMMGRAFEGPDQGVVRFRVEIAPDGRLTRLETLWSTSPAAEQLARKAIENMPALPPTPTGRPLVFEKTIAFQPFDVDDTPTYQDDCLPERPAFHNPYAWDGKAPQGAAVQPSAEKVDTATLEECQKQLPEASVEAASAHDRRQLEQWRSGRLGP